jgi:hypothetical protein
MMINISLQASILEKISFPKWNDLNSWQKLRMRVRAMTHDPDNVSAELTNSPPIASSPGGEPNGSQASRAGASFQDLNSKERPSADARKDWVPDRERRVLELPSERTGRNLEPDRGEAGNSRRGFLRRRPFVSAIGMFLLVVGAAGGSLYWDYARHFETQCS